LVNLRQIGKSGSRTNGLLTKWEDTRKRKERKVATNIEKKGSSKEEANRRSGGERKKRVD